MTPASCAGVLRRYAWDAVLAIALAASAGLVVIRVAPVLWPPLLEYPNGDVWFSGDPRRVFANMTDRTSNEYRSKVHPLFPLTALPVLAGHRVFGVPLDRAARWYVALQGALWAAALYALLRVARLRVPDALVFAGLGLVSAAARFWSSVPETYILGSITIMLAVSVAAAAKERDPTDARLMLVSAATLSVTLTNWMAGLLCTLVTRPWRRALQLSVNAFALVTLLWGVQKTLFPTTQFFLGDREEGHYVFRPTPGRVFSVGRAFLFHSMIMPAIPGVATDGNFRIQHSSAGSASRWGLVGAAAWGGLLLLGMGAAVRTEGRSTLGLISAGILASEFGLHTVYGEETFLYSLNWLPLLVLVASTATRTRLRPAALVLAGIVAVSGGINNARQFRAAVHSVVSRSSQRAQVLEAMARRPTDPWPRGEGHVVLGFPGSQPIDKGYIEPGGSFSPRVKSFGVAIWVLGPDGAPVATSDDLPLGEIRQRFIPAGEGGPPAVAIETRYYRAIWALVSPLKWDLRLSRTPGSPNRLAVVV